MFDKELILSEDQAITGSGNSTKRADLGHDNPNGYPTAWLKLLVTESFVGVGDITFRATHDAVDGTGATHTQIYTFPYANLVKGKQIYLPLAILGDVVQLERFIGLNWVVVGGDATAGKITAGLVDSPDNVA